MQQLLCKLLLPSGKIKDSPSILHRIPPPEQAMPATGLRRGAARGNDP